MYTPQRNIVTERPSTCTAVGIRSPFIDRGDGVGVRSCRPLCREDTVLVLLESKVGDRIEFIEILAEDTGPMAIDRRACWCTLCGTKMRVELNAKSNLYRERGIDRT